MSQEENGNGSPKTSMVLENTDGGSATFRTFNSDSNMEEFSSFDISDDENKESNYHILTSETKSKNPINEVLPSSDSSTDRYNLIPPISSQYYSKDTAPTSVSDNSTIAKSDKNLENYGKSSSRKRLSRHNELMDDGDTDDDNKEELTEPSNIFGSINLLFSNLKLETALSNGKSLTMASSNLEIGELQRQLTDCKIQLTLQSDLLRDKFNFPRENDEEYNHIEQNVIESFNSIKYNLELQEIKKNYHDSKEENKILNDQMEEMINSFNILQNQLDLLQEDYQNWQVLVEKIILILDRTGESINNKEEKFDNFSNKLKIVLRYAQQLSDVNRDLTKGIEGKDEIIERLTLQLKKLLKNFKLQDASFNELSKIIKKHPLFDETGLEEQINININNEKSSKLESLLKNYKSETDTLNEKVKLLQKELFEKKELLHDLSEQFNVLQHSKELLEVSNEKLTQVNQKKVQEDVGTTTALLGSDDLIISEVKFHTLLIKILSKVLDEQSIKKVMSYIILLSENAKYNLTYESIKEILTILYEYNLNAINTIIENYDSFVKKVKQEANNTRTIAALKGEISFLNNRILEIEKRKERDKKRKNENDKESEMVQEDANKEGSEEKIDRIIQLRLDDLTKRWKTAEEALSFERKQSELKFQELEEENQFLKEELSRK